MISSFCQGFWLFSLSNLVIDFFFFVNSLNAIPHWVENIVFEIAMQFIFQKFSFFLEQLSILHCLKLKSKIFE